MIDFDISPSPDRLDKQLLKLEQALQGKAVRTGIVAAIAPIKREIKATAPRKSGALAGGVGHVAVSKSAQGRLGKGGQVTILVGVTRNKQGYKAIYQEYGTERMDANPFIFPAWERQQSGFQTRFYAGLKKFLDKQAA